VGKHAEVGAHLQPVLLSEGVCSVSKVGHAKLRLLKAHMHLPPVVSCSAVP
jgi:hypothetical protein